MLPPVLFVSLFFLDSNMFFLGRLEKTFSTEKHSQSSQKPQVNCVNKRFLLIAHDIMDYWKWWFLLLVMHPTARGVLCLVRRVKNIMSTKAINWKKKHTKHTRQKTKQNNQFIFPYPSCLFDCFPSLPTFYFTYPSYWLCRSCFFVPLCCGHFLLL